MRLIDADALLAKSFKYRIGGVTTTDVVIVNNIKTAPTIDAEPVRHGHWETLLIGNIQCSRCGHEPYWDSDDWKLNCGNPYYCPNCGAKMDEEVNT